MLFQADQAVQLKHRRKKNDQGRGVHNKLHDNIIRYPPLSLSLSEFSLLYSAKSFSSKLLRGDFFVYHVTGAQKHNLLCFAVGRLIIKYDRV